MDFKWISRLESIESSRLAASLNLVAWIQWSKRMNNWSMHPT